jgi:hypothetical protein
MPRGLTEAQTVRGTMDSAAEYYAEALDYEVKAETAQAEEARALFLAVAARWRIMGEEAAVREADCRPISSVSLST